MVVIVRHNTPENVAAHLIWKEMEYEQVYEGFGGVNVMVRTAVHIELRRIRVASPDHQNSMITRVWLRERCYTDQDGFTRWAFIGMANEQEARAWVGVGR